MTRPAGPAGKLHTGMTNLLAGKAFSAQVTGTSGRSVFIHRPGQAGADEQAYPAAPGLAGADTNLTALATALAHQSTDLTAAANALRIAAAALSSPIFNTVADAIAAAAADATAAAAAASAAATAHNVQPNDRVLVVEASGTWTVVAKLVT